MNPTIRWVGLLVILLVASPRAQETGDLVIQLHALHRSVILGSPIELDIEFVNVSQRPIHLSRTDDLGPSAINIIARKGACAYPVTAVHWDSVADRALMFTRLFPGDRLWQGLTVSDLEIATGELSLPVPGAYRFQATFRSEGPLVPGAPAGVWHGFAASPEVTIVVNPPALTKLERMREALRLSLQSGDVDFTAARYFQYVRDSTAAELLVLLLEKHPDNPFLLDAVAHQHRSGDATVLDSIARTRLRGGDSTSADHAKAVANRLRNPDACD